MNLLELLDRPIAFHRVFARLAGSVHAGILLSQAVYWSGRTSDPAGWFYKTQAEWEEETCLTRREQETARGLLRRLMHQNASLWREERRGVPARMFYQVNFEVLGGLLAGVQSVGNRHASMAESAKLACTNPPNWHGGNRQTIICTESTIRDYEHRVPMTEAHASDALVFDAPIPKPVSKYEQLATISEPQGMPTESEFERFLEKSEEGQYVLKYRSDLYSQFCDHKWHEWDKKKDKWTAIRDWKSYTLKLGEKIRNDMP